MTMTDVPLMVTVFHACKSDRHFAENGCVHGDAAVTEKKPPTGDWNLLFELHVPTSEIKPTKKKGEGTIVWDTALQWPMQVGSL